MALLDRGTLVGLTAASLLVLPLQAQIVGQPPAVRECLQWAQDLAKGGPPAASALNSSNLPACPNGPSALASALRRSGQRRDTAYLYALTLNAASVRDPRLFDAALALAADERAAAPPRAAAILVLVAQSGAGWEYPGVSGSRLLTDTLSTAPICGPGIAPTDSYIVASVLPPDSRMRMARVLEAIERSRAPVLLRKLAHCSLPAHAP